MSVNAVNLRSVRLNQRRIAAMFGASKQVTVPALPAMVRADYSSRPIGQTELLFLFSEIDVRNTIGCLRMGFSEEQLLYNIFHFM